MPRRSYTGRPALFAPGASVWFLCISMLTSMAANAVGFVKDPAFARVLGETLFHDTVDVMSDPSTAQAAAAPAGAPDPSRDNSAVGQVARRVLANQTLDKYLWLIQQAYDDTLWKGGDRGQIEQHFPLIWRTSIMLYEATLNASPHRVRVCRPADDGESFECRDEVERAKIVPIPAQAPLLSANSQPNIG